MYQKKKLLADSGSPLGKHLIGYAKAHAQANATTEENVIIRVYDQMLEALASGSMDLRETGYDIFSPIGTTFEAYVDALVKTDRKEKVIPLVKLLGPRWNHNMGCGQLGEAAYKAGDFKTAEHYLGKLRTGSENWERDDGISLLARIWHKQGKTIESERLLLESMRRLLVEAGDAGGSDRKLYEKWYQEKRRTFKALFPKVADDRLKMENLPESTLRST